MMAPKAVNDRPAPRLYLVTPVIEDAEAFLRQLEAALESADVAAVLVRVRALSEREEINLIKRLAPSVQTRGAAFLVDGRADLATLGGADGAHLAGIETFEAAAPGLQPARIAGAGGLRTKHDAMLAAERGADYVMFGEPDAAGRPGAVDAALERVAWWSEVFQVPCVGYAGEPDAVAAMAAAGADFVALGTYIWDTPDAVAAIREAAKILASQSNLESV